MCIGVPTAFSNYKFKQNVTPQSKKALKTIIETCLAVKRDEHLAIVIHEKQHAIGGALWNIARRFTRNLTIIYFSNVKKDDCQMNHGICDLLRNVDVGIIITPGVLQVDQLGSAQQTGTRIVVIQNSSENLIERALDSNFYRVSMKSRKVADLFSIGKSLHVMSPTGTDLKVDINNLLATAETGLANKPGELASIPAGEANLIIKNATGKIAIDRIAGNKKKLSQPILMFVNQGKITQIKGSVEADLLKKQLRKFGTDARKLYEFGLGTNKSVVLGRSGEEDEKANGAVHISFGQNLTKPENGKIVPSIKGIIMKATLSLDGNIIAQNGEFLF